MPTAFRILAGFWVLFSTWVVVAHLSVLAGGTVAALAALGIGAAVAWALLGFFLAGYARGSGRGRGANSEDGWTFVLAVLTAIAASLWFVPTTDDALYGSLAVSVADFPEVALASFDWVHGRLDEPAPRSGYLLMALELLQGTLAWLTNSEAVLWSHQVFPGIFGFVGGLGWCLLLRALAPERWRIAYLLMLAFWVLVPQTMYSWFGMLHLGKTLLHLALLPFISVAALRFMAAPSLRGWGFLLASQIASAGLSPTGLWFGPAVLASTVLAAPGFSPRGAWRRMLPAAGLALLTSCYPIGAGATLFALGAFEQASTATTDLSNVEASPTGNSKRLRWDAGFSHSANIASLFDLQRGWAWFVKQGWSWRLPLQSVPLFLGALILILAFGSREQRYFFSTNAALVVILLNPLALNLFRFFSIPAQTHWRTLWIFPGAMVLGLALSLPLAVRFRRASRWQRATSMGLVLGACGVVYSTGAFLPNRNPTTFGPLSIRQPSHAWYAKRIGDIVPPGSAVVVPPWIAPWVITYRDHPQPLIVRRHYSYIYHHYYSPEEQRNRENLQAAVGPKLLVQETGDPPLMGECEISPRRLWLGIARYDIRGLVVSSQCNGISELREMLESMGFRRDQEEPPDSAGPAVYELWGRPPDTAAPGRK